MCEPSFARNNVCELFQRAQRKFCSKLDLYTQDPEAKICEAQTLVLVMIAEIGDHDSFCKYIEGNSKKKKRT